MSQHAGGPWESTWYSLWLYAMQSSAFSATPACETEPSQAAIPNWHMSGLGIQTVCIRPSRTLECPNDVADKAFITFNRDLALALISCVCVGERSNHSR